MSLDGLGAKYLEFYVTNAPAQFPNFVRLRSEGAFTFNARCDYDFSETVPNHATMFTARPVYQPQGAPNTTHHGFENNFPSPTETLHTSGNLNVPYKASVFDVAHDYGLSTAFYASKTRLAICERSYDAINGALDLIDFDNGRDKIDFASVSDLSGANITNEVNSLIQDLTNSAPKRYSFVHLAEPDLTGHGSDWGSPAWSNVVRLVDAQLGRVLGAIEMNPVLSNQTALVITADHGGGGVLRNAHTEAYHITNYTIPFIVWGPGIPAGIDAYQLFSNRGDPGTNRMAYHEFPQPLRDGDASNLSLMLLGLPSIPGSYFLPSMQPLLTAFRTSGQLVLSWPMFAENYVLEVTKALNGTEWQRISNGVVRTASGFRYEVSPVPGEPPGFYRLRSPAFSIVGQPSAQTVFAGQAASFQINVSGIGPFSYQWLSNEDPITGATSSSFTIPSTGASDSGSYRVSVSDGTDTLVSKPATLTVLTRPQITIQPTNQYVVSNATAQFTVQASGFGSLTYQWRKNGVDIDGAITPSLSVSNVYLPQEGDYTVAVTDANGTTVSAIAKLFVLIAPTIVQNLIPQTVGVGQSVTFSVTIEGNPPPYTYEWFRGSLGRSTNLLTSKTSTFTITNVQLSDAGNYRVVIRNAALPNGRNSGFAALMVTNPPAQFSPTR